MSVYKSEKRTEVWRERALKAEAESSALAQKAQELCTEVVRVALTRPHDGSQLDEDLEGLLLQARALPSAPPATQETPEKGAVMFHGDAVRKEVRILIETRGVHLEAVAEVFGDNTPEEATSLVRAMLKAADLRVEFVDPAVEG